MAVADKQHSENVQHFELADAVVADAVVGGDGNMHHTSGVVEVVVVVVHPIVGKVHNLEGELCDGKAWHEKAEVGHVEEP